VKKAVHLWHRKSPVDVAKTRLFVAENYEQWQAGAYYLDRLTGSDLWRHNFTSKKYDYRLISERLKSLKEARQTGDVDVLLKLFRTGSFLRNFGGISNRELFNRSYAGTKILIEDYITEVLHCLEYLDEVDFHDHELTSNQLKLDFFHDARQAFGSTALVLQGGSLFGLCHLGVMKALYFKGLLPRIISGSAIGAVVASLVCTLTNDELADTLTNISESLSKIDRLNTDVDERYGSVIENVITKGYSQDILVFMKYVKDHLGDITFEEAYVKTDKILNIIVHPTDKAVPTLLNYVTTPNVVIWSALYASIGTGVLSDHVSLYIKDINNEIVSASFNAGKPCTFLTPQKANERPGEESPYTRVTELFNVNNFIVSLARPYLAPLIVNDIKHKSGWKPLRMVQRLLGMELQHRVDLMDRTGMLFSFIKRMAVDEKTPKNSSEVTIVPELRTLVKDFGRVFDVHRTLENIPYWIHVGEKSVWPVLPILWTRCAVEFTLDNLHNRRRRRRV
jgi:TAG lipase/lysophosphatidylethanolamine acyltransferase